MLDWNMVQDIDDRDYIELSVRPGIFFGYVFKTKTATAVTTSHRVGAIDCGAGRIEAESGDTKLEVLKKAEKDSAAATNVQHRSSGRDDREQLVEGTELRTKMLHFPAQYRPVAKKFPRSS